MKYIQNTIDTIKGRRVLVVSFTGSSPHLETSLEVTRRLSINNSISYIHLGESVSRPTLYPSNIIKRKLQLPLRINRARNYLKASNNKSNYVTLLDPKVVVEKILKSKNSISIETINKEFYSLEQLKEISFQKYNIGIGLSSTLISWMKDPSPFPLNSKSIKEVRELYRSAVRSVLIAEELLKRGDEEYDLVVLLNGRFACENAFKQVAISKDIDVYFHECGSPYPHNRFYFENYMPHDFSKRKLEMREIQRNLPEDVIYSIGKDFFDRKTSGEGIYEESYVKDQSQYLSEGLKEKIKLAKINGQKIISYYTSSDDEYQLIDKASARYPLWGNQRLAIKRIADMANKENYYLIVRVHPNLKNKSKAEQKRWKILGEEINKRGFYWINQEDPEPTYGLIKESQIILSAGSTVGVESSFLGKKSIVITECYYNDIIPSIKVCRDEKELGQCINNHNEKTNIKYEDSLIYGAWAMTYGTEFDYFDHNDYGIGMMKNGMRIASPGLLQRIFSHSKNVLKGIRI